MEKELFDLVDFFTENIGKNTLIIVLHHGENVKNAVMNYLQVVINLNIL